MAQAECLHVSVNYEISPIFLSARVVVPKRYILTLTTNLSARWPATVKGNKTEEDTYRI